MNSHDRVLRALRDRAEQAESQLAEATRRLREVEAFIPENGYVAVAWVRDGDVCCIDPTDDPTEMMDEGWLPAALIPPSMPFALSVTKEPTK